MKLEYSKAISMATTDEVIKISEILKDKHTIKTIKKPQKTLTMVKMREVVNASLFYLGEVLCCECMVEIDGVKGFFVTMGDDFEKVQAAATIDGAYNAKFQECELLDAVLDDLVKKQIDERKNMNGEILKSKVDFNLMGE